MIGAHHKIAKLEEEQKNIFPVNFFVTFFSLRLIPDNHSWRTFRRRCDKNEKKNILSKKQNSKLRLKAKTRNDGARSSFDSGSVSRPEVEEVREASDGGPREEAAGGHRGRDQPAKHQNRTSALDCFNGIGR